jgi:3-oxoacyl-[acyl-carrier-protein] synthase-3
MAAQLEHTLADRAPEGTPSGEVVLPHRILGTGIGVPRTIVTNAELTRDLDTDDAWIRDRTGIRERRFLEEGQATSDLCVDAALQALRSADVAGRHVDAVILATITPDQPLPSTALMVATAIGADQAVPIDLNQAACAGGVLGMLLGIHMLQDARMRHVLVIGGETLSRITDPGDRTTRVFFGDAAGAVLLGCASGTEHGLLGWDVDATLSYSVEVPAGGVAMPPSAETVAAGGHYLKMDGKAVWHKATEALPKSIEQAVARAGMTLHDIAHFVIHQANRNIVEAAMDRLGVERERAGVTVDWLGNTGAATVFTVLHSAVASKKVQPGDVVVVSAIGAGFICGSLVIRYG